MFLYQNWIHRTPGNWNGNMCNIKKWYPLCLYRGTSGACVHSLIDLLVTFDENSREDHWHPSQGCAHTPALTCFPASCAQLCPSSTLQLWLLMWPCSWESWNPGSLWPSLHWSLLPKGCAVGGNIQNTSFLTSRRSKFLGAVHALILPTGPGRARLSPDIAPLLGLSPFPCLPPPLAFPPQNTYLITCIHLFVQGLYWENPI